MPLRPSLAISLVLFLACGAPAVLAQAPEAEASPVKGPGMESEATGRSETSIPEVEGAGAAAADAEDNGAASALEAVDAEAVDAEDNEPASPEAPGPAAAPEAAAPEPAEPEPAEPEPAEPPSQTPAAETPTPPAPIAPAPQPARLQPATEQGLIRQAEEQYSQGQFDAALATLQRLLQAQQSRPAQQAETYNLIGLVHDRRQQFDASVAAYQTALGLYRGVAGQGDVTLATQGEAKTLNNLGTLYAAQGRVPEALGFLERSLGLSRRLKLRDNEAITLRNIANLYLQAEQPQEAIASLEASLEIEIELQRPPQIVALLDRLSGLYLSVGALPRAVVATEEAFKIVEPTQDHESKLLLLDRLGSLYSELGQGDRALRAYSSALGLVQRAGDRILEGRLRNRLASLHGELGQTDQALRQYEAVLAIAEVGEDRLSQARILTSMGDLYRRERRWDAAQSTYRQALALVESLGNPLAKGQLLTALAALANDQAQPDQALKLAQQAVAAQQVTLPAGAGNTEEQASLNLSQAASLSLIGELHTQQGQYGPAVEAYRQSLAILGQRGNPLLQGANLSGLGIALTKLNRPAEAIVPLEDALRLWEAVGLEAVEVGEEDLVEASYAALVGAHLAQNRPEAALVALEQQRSRLLRSYLDLRAPAADQLTESLTLAQIQQQAKRHQATLVLYDLAVDWATAASADARAKASPQELRIWVVSPDGKVAYKTVALEADFAKALAPGAEGDRLQTLATYLIAPIADLLPAAPDRPLMLVPPAALAQLPFAALPLTGQGRGKTLVEQQPLIMLPALQTLARPAASAPVRQRSLAPALVVGDPQLPGMGRRPAVVEELTAVAKLLETQAITGKDATLQAIAQPLSQARTIHLALPQLTIANGVEALAFSSEGAIEGITPVDILSAKLGAELVVIHGLVAQADPVGPTQMSLAQAFLAAGTPVVVTSLGRASEAAGRDLMVAFYQALGEDLAPAAALRQAMLQVRQQHPDPKDWASFVVMGQ